MSLLTAENLQRLQDEVHLLQGDDEMVHEGFIPKRMKDDPDEGGSSSVIVHRGARADGAPPPHPNEMTKKPTDLVWYFAYGSNMNTDQLISRIGLFVERRLFRVENYDLMFNKLQDQTPFSTNVFRSGCANIVPNANSTVFGVAFRITPQQLQQLDSYEGVEHNQYTRVAMELVDCTNEEPTTAEVYVAHPSTVQEGLLPHERYLSKMLFGGRSLLPAEYLRKLQAHPVMRSSFMHQQRFQLLSRVF